MKKNILIAVLIAFTSISCSTSSKEDKGEEHVYWVNSYKVDCVGVGPMSCFQYIKGEEFHEDQWKTFYGNIEGFDYEPGFVYKVVVREEHLDPKDVPADASSIKYTLVRIMDKEPDMKLRINDIWALEMIEDKEVSSFLKEGVERPTIEFQVSSMKFMGSDGCNSFNGKIDHLGLKLILLGPAAGTRKMCVDMSLSDSVNKYLGDVKSYKIEDNKLFLMNDGGVNLLTYKKID